MTRQIEYFQHSYHIQTPLKAEKVVNDLVQLTKLAQLRQIQGFPPIIFKIILNYL